MEGRDFAPSPHALYCNVAMPLATRERDPSPSRTWPKQAPSHTTQTGPRAPQRYRPMTSPVCQASWLLPRCTNKSPLHPIHCPGQQRPTSRRPDTAGLPNENRVIQGAVLQPKRPSRRYLASHRFPHASTQAPAHDRLMHAQFHACSGPR